MQNICCQNVYFLYIFNECNDFCIECLDYVPGYYKLNEFIQKCDTHKVHWLISDLKVKFVQRLETLPYFTNWNDINELIKRLGRCVHCTKKTYMYEHIRAYK